MTTTTQESVTADNAIVTVISRDGIAIGARVSGSGRPLVLLHGTSSDSSAWRAVAELLGRTSSVYRVDRRGRGSSGDGPTYTIEAEYDDAIAVVDAAADAYGGPVDMLGQSYCGNVAFGAALRTGNLRRLVLYEGWPHRIPRTAAMIRSCTRRWLNWHRRIPSACSRCSCATAPG